MKTKVTLITAPDSTDGKVVARVETVSDGRFADVSWGADSTEPDVSAAIGEGLARLDFSRQLYTWFHLCSPWMPARAKLTGTGRFGKCVNLPVSAAVELHGFVSAHFRLATIREEGS